MRVTLNKDRLQSRFVEKVEEISGQNLRACYQCGKCSAGCPMVDSMDILPNQVIRLVQLGMEHEAVSCETIWLCASCVMCYARCPRGVDLSRVMEALRQIALRARQDRIDPPSLSPETIEKLPQIALVSGFRKLTG